MSQADSAIVSQYVNYFLKFHPYFINMRFQVFVNRSNFESLEIEEIIFVKIQVCENRYAILDMGAFNNYVDKMGGRGGHSNPSPLLISTGFLKYPLELKKKFSDH